MTRIRAARQDLIQARGGIQAGSEPQRTCDGCQEGLSPAEAVEVTITTPGRVDGRCITRLYAHRDDGCCARVLARAAFVLVGE